MSRRTFGARKGRWVVLTALFTLFVWGCSGGGSSEGTGEAGAGSPPEAEAAAAPTGADAQPQPNASGWLLVDGSDAGAGAADVELAREASRGVNSTGISPTLHLRCVDGESEVVIVWYEDPEGSDNDVTTQIGHADPVRRTWTNQNEDATVFPSDSAAIFIQRLTEADSLTASTNLYKRMPVTAVFDLTGLSERMEPLREACDL